MLNRPRGRPVPLPPGDSPQVPPMGGESGYSDLTLLDCPPYMARPYVPRQRQEGGS